MCQKFLSSDLSYEAKLSQKKDVFVAKGDSVYWGSVDEREAADGFAENASAS
jgi:hypothetical protein